MNGQKIVSALSVLVAVGLGPVFAYALSAEDASSRFPLPSAAKAAKGAVLAEGASEAPPPSLVLPETVRATPVVIVASAPRAPVKVWTCGAPRALRNDETQTVRPCEWR